MAQPPKYARTPGMSLLFGFSTLHARLHSIALGGVCFTLLMLGGTMVMAVASYELYERQWLRLKTRFSYDKGPTQLAA